MWLFFWWPCHPPTPLPTTHFSQIEAAIYLEPDLNEVKCPYSGKDVEVANKAETVNIFSMYDNVWFNTTVNKFQLLFKFITKYLISYFLKCCVSFPNPFAFKRRQWPLSPNQRVTSLYQQNMLWFDCMMAERSCHYSHCKNENLAIHIKNINFTKFIPADIKK